MDKKLVFIGILISSYMFNVSGISISRDTAFLADFEQIIKTDSSIIIARVTRISNSNVFYVYPLNQEELTIPRKKIHQIIYSSEKIEKFNPLTDKFIDEKESINWENVEVLKDEFQTDTLIEISNFEALYESTKMKISTNQLEKNVLVILKKKTANVGGKYLFITDKIIHKAYGDLPSIEMFGKAYRPK